MPFALLADGFSLSLRGREVLQHSVAAPCLFAGRGREMMLMLQGNFDITDYVEERAPLAHVTVAGDRLDFRRDVAGAVWVSLRLAETADGAVLEVAYAAEGLNRFWFRLLADPDEHVWGCGEQMSYFDLRGRRFPLWTSEPGVGRDKTTEITFKADAKNRAGGDYYTTNYPQPTYVSSRRLAVHLETTAYSVFDFRNDEFHELEVWHLPERLEIFAAADFIDLVGMLSQRFGRQPALPDWVLNGAIIGLKQGAEGFARLEKYIDAGVQVSGLWCEDWAGVRQTSFGTRLFWDWQWNAARYPDLPARIAALQKRNIRFLGYVSPYLCDDGVLFGEAAARGLFAKDAAGATLLVDFGEFSCGVLDFTLDAARVWFRERIIRDNMIGLGLSGWMADFGEYLPIDAHLANGMDAKLAHNAWPPIWAEVNAQAVSDAGRTGDILFFMRAGFTGTQAHCPLLWAGDQCVDFSRHDGLQTVMVGALSSGLLGNAYHHSDVGGYTSLFGNVRTKELIMRWAEMAAFTPVMRTHEGNRPQENLQVDQDADVLAHFARMTGIYKALAPYTRTLIADAQTRGLPVQRALFLHFPQDRATYAIQDQYLYGPDLLVAPVHAAGQTAWPVYLPEGACWVHLWSGKHYEGGQRVTVAAEIGQPPVFQRARTPFAKLFEEICKNR